MEISRSLNLDRKIDGAILERILIMSAEDLELQTHSKDIFNEIYELKNGKFSKKNLYYETKMLVSPKKKLYILCEINGIKKGEERNWFRIEFGGNVAVSLQEEVEEYLSKVAENLNSCREVPEDSLPSSEVEYN